MAAPSEMIFVDKKTAAQGMFNPHALQVNIQLREPLEKGKDYGFSVKISNLFTF